MLVILRLALLTANISGPHYSGSKLNQNSSDIFLSLYGLSLYVSVLLGLINSPHKL